MINNIRRDITSDDRSRGATETGEAETRLTF